MHVCYTDADCEEAKSCKKIKVQWEGDNNIEDWGIYNRCEIDDGMIELCNLIGDHTITYNRSSTYSVSYNCENKPIVDIGGAHTAVATLIAILAAFLIVN